MKLAFIILTLVLTLLTTNAQSPILLEDEQLANMMDDLLKNIRDKHEEMLDKNEIFEIDFERPIFNHHLPKGVNETKNDFLEVTNKLEKIERKPHKKKHHHKKKDLYHILKKILKHKLNLDGFKEAANTFTNMIKNNLSQEKDTIGKLKNMFSNSKPLKDVFSAIEDFVEGKGKSLRGGN